MPLLKRDEFRSLRCNGCCPLRQEAFAYFFSTRLYTPEKANGPASLRGHRSLLVVRHIGAALGTLRSGLLLQGFGTLFEGLTFIARPHNGLLVRVHTALHRKVKPARAGPGRKRSVDECRPLAGPAVGFTTARARVLRAPRRRMPSWKRTAQRPRARCARYAAGRRSA